MSSASRKSRPRGSAKPHRAAPKPLRTCFLAALFFSVEGYPVAFAQVGMPSPIDSGSLVVTANQPLNQLNSQLNSQSTGQSNSATTGQASFIPTTVDASQPSTVIPASGVVTANSTQPQSQQPIHQQPVNQQLVNQQVMTEPLVTEPYVTEQHAGVITEPATNPLDPSKLISTDDQNIKMLEPEAIAPSRYDLYDLSVSPFTVYRSEESMLTYMPGDGEQFGWLSFESPNYLSRSQHSGLTTNMNLHLLSGPQTVHLPPRLYDFELGYQMRKTINSTFSYDLSTMVGVYSDFEDSARDGVRFPSHAVGMFHPDPRIDWVFGIDYLGRDDIKMLPVAGFVWHNPDRPQVRYEMVFPRPRIDWTLSENNRIYCLGALGGGTWDIELPDDSNDVMTYRDYRLAIGIESSGEDNRLNAWELAWTFSREVEFRDSPVDADFGDALTLRCITRH